MPHRSAGSLKIRKPGPGIGFVSMKRKAALLLLLAALACGVLASPAGAYTQAARQAGQKAITNACLLRTGCHNITTYAASEGDSSTTFYFYFYTAYCGTMRGQVWVSDSGRVLQFIARSSICSTYY